MSRLESLKAMRAAIESIEPERLGVTILFRDPECLHPWCSIGHAIATIPGVRDRYIELIKSVFLRGGVPSLALASKALGITEDDLVEVFDANDHTPAPDRKAAVLKAIDLRIKDAEGVS